MKLRFKINCKDKNDGTAYKKGKVYEFDDERGREILETVVNGNAVASEVKPRKSKKAKE